METKRNKMLDKRMRQNKMHQSSGSCFFFFCFTTVPIPFLPKGHRLDSPCPYTFDAHLHIFRAKCFPLFRGSKKSKSNNSEESKKRVPHFSPTIQLIFWGWKTPVNFFVAFKKLKGKLRWSERRRRRWREICWHKSRVV